MKPLTGYQIPDYKSQGEYIAAMTGNLFSHDERIHIRAYVGWHIETEVGKNVNIRLRNRLWELGRGCRYARLRLTNILD